MNPTLKVSGIVIFGLIVSFSLPHIITISTTKTLKSDPVVTVKTTTKSKNDSIAYTPKRDTATPVEQKQETEVVEEEIKAEEEIVAEEETPKEETKEEPKPVVEEVQAQEIIETLSYEQMNTEQLINAIANGTFKLEYTNGYDTNGNKLTKSKGAINYDGHRETYYSQKVLPGTTLKIPGRHVADDGTIRDEEGYICIAASTSYLSKGSVVKTSLGPAKVYDSGCAYGTIDIYTNW